MEERMVFGPPNMGVLPTEQDKFDEQFKTPRRAKVPAATFIEVYNKADSPADAAKELGMDVATLNVRASILRKQGKLNKQFQRGRKKKKGATPFETPGVKDEEQKQENDSQGEDRNQASE